MAVRSAVLRLNLNGLNYKSVVQLEAAVEAALKGALNAQESSAFVETVQYDERSEELLRRSFEGLEEFYPVLNHKNVPVFVRKGITVPNTGDDQADYEATKSQIEQFLGEFGEEPVSNEEME